MKAEGRKSERGKVCGKKTNPGEREIVAELSCFWGVCALCQLPACELAKN